MTASLTASPDLATRPAVIDFRQPAAPLHRLDWLPDAVPQSGAGGVYYQDAALGSTVAQATLPALDTELGTLSQHVFLLVQSGRVTLRLADGGEAELQAGQTAVLPRGLALGWRNTAGTQLISITLAGEAPPAGSTPQLLRPDPSAALAPSAGPAAALLTTPAPSCSKLLCFEDSTEQLEVGVWQSTPYARSAKAFGHSELMYLVEGRVSITDPSGQVLSFGPGEPFLIPRDTPCAWDSTVLVKKVYCTISPA